MRTLLLAATLALAACGGAKTEAPQAPTDITKLDKVKLDEMAKAGDEAAAAELHKRDLAEQKAAFDAAGKDEGKLTELAGAGNAYALHARAVQELASDIAPVQQAGYVDMEAAAEKGLPEAQLWVGDKMANGINGYPWKPNSGMKMIEKAANQGNVDAMFALAELYYQDQPMQDKAKAKEWYQKAADHGDERAKKVLEQTGLPGAGGADSGPPKPN
jgi:TPR repeat protein